MSAQLSAWILVVHLAATAYMVGLVCFVQRVHYPLFARVGGPSFVDYQRAHLARTRAVVGPPMLLEAATGLTLVAWPDPRVPLAAGYLGLALLAAIWLSTLGLQIPRHRELEQGFDLRSHRRLVATNWVRTVCWSLRGLLVMGIAVVAIGSSRA